jgi:hypothetical protein
VAFENTLVTKTPVPTAEATRAKRRVCKMTIEMRDRAILVILLRVLAYFLFRQ